MTAAISRPSAGSRPSSSPLPFLVFTSLGKRCCARQAFVASLTIGRHRTVLQAVFPHVVSFDIASDGTILFSNGYGVFALDGANPPQILLRDKLIADVIAAPAAASPEIQAPQ